MIARIRGSLVELEQNIALIEAGHLTYEVMLAGYAVSELAGSLGEEVSLYTIQYFEGTVGKGNLIPRLVGFLGAEDRFFFDTYTTVKGLGIKTALKSLSMPIANIAFAIEQSDVSFLTSLPGIGKRTAQLIVAELAGKVTEFAVMNTSSGEKVQIAGKLCDYQLEAVEILVAWGERRNEAIEYINTVAQKHPEAQAAEELIPLVYKYKQGANA